MRKIYGMIGALLLGLAMTGQAQKIVRGVVQDRSGTPLPGVTVRLKGTAVSTATTGEGKYQLAVFGDTVSMEFGFVGYRTVEKKLILTSDTTQLTPVQLREECTIDYFNYRHIELSVVSGLRYTPLGGRIKALYPYRLPIGSGTQAVRVEFGYQTGSQAYQRNATLALDDIIEDCDNDGTVGVDYQQVELGNQAFAFTRYSLWATYAYQEINSTFPAYVAVGRLRYVRDGREASRTGLEVGVDHPFYIRGGPELVLSGRIAWWQDYWQFRGGLEAEYRRFTAGITFNQLGPYTELNTRLGYKLPLRHRARKRT